MKIIEQHNEIVLRDVPAQNWARGVLCLVCMVIFGVGLLGGIAQMPSQNVTGGVIFFSALEIFCLYWAYRLLSLPVTVTRVIPAERTVEITTRRFLFLKSTRRIDFSEIERFEIVRRKPNRAFLYFTVLTLRDGSQIDLESDGNALEGAANIVPVRLNEILKNNPIRRRKRSQNE